MRIKVSTTDLPILLPLLPNITGLNLQLVGPAEDVLEHISVMRQLELLELEFEDAVHLEKKSLLSLAQCSKLRELHINPEANVSSLESGFSDADFKQVVSKLPDLERLTFHVQSDLSAVSLLSLAKYCPRLESCTMPHMFDMDQLGLASQSRPLFPKLTELSLGGFEAPPLQDGDESANRRTSATDLAELLHRHMPRLTELYLDSDEEYSDAVLAAFDP
ncbi:hypothetical protein NQ176_g11291 [Zarea fungicola]|uniref:Uncharacterized protein n=1 Tax=Zarea fungicola TaxID=93591 RepID=A0ACC1MBC0_9HYPO|nr:hypothetical protein NQ176_g11291 [Lecanicillium fungicola]